MPHFSKLALCSSIVILLAACSSTPVVEKKDEPAATPAVEKPSARQVTPVAAAVEADPLDDPKSILAKRSVYFDFNQFTVRTEFAPVLTAHANYLQQHQQRKVIIQGNADERGGAEYNLALGQKRAEAVRKSLSLQGVPESAMEAISFGKEKPKAMGSNEAAWAENRRADLVYAR